MAEIGPALAAAYEPPAQQGNPAAPADVTPAPLHRPDFGRLPDQGGVPRLQREGALDRDPAGVHRGPAEQTLHAGAASQPPPWSGPRTSVTRDTGTGWLIRSASAKGGRPRRDRRRHRRGDRRPPGRQPHGLRRSFATAAISARVPVEVVAAQLGNMSRVTQEVYAHAPGGRRRGRAGRRGPLPG